MDGFELRRCAVSFLVSDVVHEGVFEAVCDAELFAEPEDALGLGVLVSYLLADVVEKARG
jgi:hypothetical protein